ncbi:MAG: hypothetical protein V8T34_09255 [Ruminococcus callidus]
MKPPEAFGHLFQRVTQLPPSGIEKIENCAVLPKEFWVHFCQQKKTFTQTENRFSGKSEPVFLLLNTFQRTITF